MLLKKMKIDHKNEIDVFVKFMDKNDDGVFRFASEEYGAIY